MLRCALVKTTVGILVLSVMICTAFGQEARQPATSAPLAFKVEWVRPKNQEDTKVRYTPVQQNVSDPNVEMKFYGAAEEFLARHLGGRFEENGYSLVDHENMVS